MRQFLIYVFCALFGITGPFFLIGALDKVGMLGTVARGSVISSVELLESVRSVKSGEQECRRYRYVSSESQCLIVSESPGQERIHQPLSHLIVNWSHFRLY